MVTAKTQYNLKNAREYFKEHLCVGDYYNEGERVVGEWVGLGAKALGIYEEGKEVLEKSNLPAELQKLLPYQVEDFLCLKKDLLHKFKSA